MEIVKNEMKIEIKDILQYIQDFSDSRGWNLEEISNQQFKAVLIATGYKFFNENTGALYKGNSRYNGLNYDALLYIYNMYRDICLMYNKTPSILGYSYLVNIDLTTIYAMTEGDAGQKSSPQAFELLQKVAQIREDSLKDRAIDKGGAVGVAIVGNAEYFWNTPQNKPYIENNNAGLELPSFQNRTAIE